ncbi:MAG: ion channel [Gaiellales bacterium]
MRIAAGVAGAALVAAMLLEFFVAIVLPQRVKRDLRIARQIFRFGWGPWRGAAGLLPGSAGETLLGFYGPLALFAELAIWGLGLVLGFAAMQWALDPSFELAHGMQRVGFSEDVYFSASQLLTVGSAGVVPEGALPRALAMLEAGTGFGVLAIVIGYLPALYQSYSRREVTVSQLEPRAGSPPSAGTLLERTAGRGRWEDLSRYLDEWETWTAELMETHLSYPVLAYFRSQHRNQNWLAALIAIVDSAALLVAVGAGTTAQSAEFTLAIGRHALADLVHVFRAHPAGAGEHAWVAERLSAAEFARLVQIVMPGVAGPVEHDAAWARLTELRASYEPQAAALADRLSLTLPRWTDDPGPAAAAA